MPESSKIIKVDNGNILRIPDRLMMTHNTSVLATWEELMMKRRQAASMLIAMDDNNMLAFYSVMEDKQMMIARLEAVINALKQGL